MKNNEKQFYLVDFQILPEAIKKTIRVKEMLKNDTSATINSAVHSMGISRSAYYKYKNHVETAFDKPKEKAVVFFILMNKDFSLFGKVLRRITKEAGEVLTINRGLSFEKTVPVTIAFKTKNLSEEIEKLSVSLKKIKGVKGITFTEEEL